MFNQIIETTHHLNLPSKETLLKLVPMSRKIVVLFFKSENVVCYDLFENKILHSLKLDGRVVQAKPLTNDELVCTLTNGSLVLLNIKDQVQKTVLSDKPLQASGLKNDANDVFVMELFVFKATGSFLVKQTAGNQVLISYFPRANGRITKQPICETLNFTDCIFQPINDKDSIAVFEQYTEGTKWTLRIYNVTTKFSEQIYRLDDDVFKDKAVVQSIQEIGSNTYLIAVNAEYKLKFLLFNPKENNLEVFKYSPNSFMEGNCLVNTKTDIMMVPRLFRDVHEGIQHGNVLDVVSLKKGEVYHSFYTTLHDTEESWEDNYLINYSRSINREKNHITFTSLLLVNKEKLYMRIMRCLKLADKYGEQLCAASINLLSEPESQ